MLRRVLLATTVVLCGLTINNQARAAAAGTPTKSCYTLGYPTANQAFVWTTAGYGGTCYLLELDSSGDGWTSWDSSVWFPNDDIEAVWIGSSVYLKLFQNSFNTTPGAITTFSPTTLSSNLGSWNNQASAARLTSFNPSLCGMNGENVLSLYQDANGGGDCTMLRTTGCYLSPVAMGFHNDSISSFKNWTAAPAYFYPDANARPAGGAYVASSYSSLTNLTGGWNDIISSVGLGTSQCWR